MPGLFRPRTCELCSKPFQVRTEEINRGKGRFCSRKCSAINRVARGILSPMVSKRGPDNPNWKGGASTKTLRKAMSRRRYNQKHIEKLRFFWRVWKAAQRARKRGVIIATPCVGCMAIEGVQGHHEDYNKPLECTWLCENCHRKLHQEKKATSRKT